MKLFAYILIGAGFISGALVSVLQDVEVNWLYYALSLAAGIVGIVQLRVLDRREKHSEETLAYNLQTLEEAIDHIVKHARQLDDNKQDINPYDMRYEIDKYFPDAINEFVASRESISHAHGLQKYADIMNNFAAGERYLNRVWSASVDGYIHEVNNYINKARAQFETTQKMVHDLEEVLGSTSGQQKV